MEDHSSIRNDGIDLSGKSVDQLASNIGLANVIYDMHRLFEVDPYVKFHYQDVDAHKNMKELDLFNQLAKCRESGRYENKTFFSNCYKYQQRETLYWRPHPKKASVIVPPLMPHDETTNVAAAKVILSMLRMVGILKCEDETSDDVRKLTLADDWDKRTFMLTGDGLSQVRARTLDDIISKDAHAYGEHHDT